MSGRRGDRVQEQRTSRIDLLQLCLIGAILTYVWRIQDLYPILATVKFPTLVSLAVLALYVLEGDRRRALTTIRHPSIYLLCGILALALLSVPTSVHDGGSFRFIRNDLSKNFVIAIILAASIRSFSDLRRYVAAFVIGAFLYAFYVYRNVTVGMRGRLGDLAYYDANDLGMLLVMTVPLALFFVVRGSHLIRRGAALAAIGLFILVLAKTGSRGAFLGLIAVSLFFLFGFKSLSRRIRVTAVVLSFSALALVGSEQYWGMMGTLLNPEDDYNWSGESETGRMEIWKRGIGYMVDRPITGVGVNVFSVAEGTVSELADRQEYGVGVKWNAAHNSFVQIGAELGVLGLLSLIFLLVVSFRTGYTNGSPRSPPRRSDPSVLGHALAATLVGYAVAGFFLSQAYSAALYVVVALVVGLWKVNTRAEPALQSASGRAHRPGHGRGGHQPGRGSKSRRPNRVLRP